MGGCGKIFVPIEPSAMSIQMLMEGIRQIGLAINEIREFQTEKEKSCQVNFTFTNEQGIEIGVVANQNAEQVEFLVKGTEVQKKKAVETINRVRQVYSKIKVMNDLKKKGYKNVKEEKLADGSVRLVLQKWQ